MENVSRAASEMRGSAEELGTLQRDRTAVDAHGDFSAEIFERCGGTGVIRVTTVAYHRHLGWAAGRFDGVEGGAVVAGEEREIISFIMDIDNLSEERHFCMSLR